MNPAKIFQFISRWTESTSQQKVGPNHCAVIKTSNEVKSPLLWEFWIYNFSLRILERVLGWKHCKYKEWVSFFLGSWGMNRSAEQTNRPRTASRFTRFVCPALRFIPHEPRKKDTHSLNISYTSKVIKIERTVDGLILNTYNTNPMYSQRQRYPPHKEVILGEYWICCNPGVKYVTCCMCRNKYQFPFDWSWESFRKLKVDFLLSILLCILNTYCIKIVTDLICDLRKSVELGTVEIQGADFSKLYWVTPNQKGRPCYQIIKLHCTWSLNSQSIGKFMNVHCGFCTPINVRYL